MMVVVFMVIKGVFALVMDFREVMRTSPPELAHCAPPPHTHTLLDQQLASKGPFWSNSTLNGQQKREKQGADTFPPPKIP